jgi:hypothetical protein
MMKMTTALRKAINAAVRDHVRGANPLAEVGLRGDGWTPNALAWTADDDLGDLTRLAELKTINDVPEWPGCAELDLYVTTGIGVNHRELETNVCILIRDGAVVGATADSLAIDALKARLGFPAGKGW